MSKMFPLSLFRALCIRKQKQCLCTSNGNIRISNMIIMVVKCQNVNILGRVSSCREHTMGCGNLLSAFVPGNMTKVLRSMLGDKTIITLTSNYYF